jgi:hypothetical protein
MTGEFILKYQSTPGMLRQDKQGEVRKHESTPSRSRLELKPADKTPPDRNGKEQADKLVLDSQGPIQVVSSAANDLLFPKT